MISSPAKATTVATFPPGFFLENILALHDDTLLVTVANRKCIYAIPPPVAPGHARQPYLLHQFADDAWAFGIVSDPNDPRLTYVLSGDFLSLGSGKFHLWLLDASNVAAAGHVKKLVEFPPETRGLNGLTTLSDGVLVAADSFAGCIWRLDIERDSSGSPIGAEVTEWMKHPLFDGTLALPDFQPGLNGLKYSPALHTLCFTSTQQKVFGTIAVDPKTWTPASEPKVVVRGPQGDDFIVDDSFAEGPVAYLTTHRDNSILRIPIPHPSDRTFKEKTGDECHVIAEGTREDPLVLGPTSGSWKVGSGGKTAYFNCDGGLKHPLEGEMPRYARVVRIDFE